VTIQITPTRRKQLRAQVFKLHQHLQWLWKASRTSHVSWETQALRRRTTELRVQAAAKKFIAHMDDSLKISGLVVVARQLWAAQGATPASMAKASYTDLSAQVNAILGPMVADAMDVSPEELKAALAGAAQAGSLAAAGDLGLTQVVWTDTEAMWRELYPGLVSDSEAMLGNVAGTHAQDVAGMLVNATDPRNPMTIAQAAGQVKDQLGDVASWKAEQIARTETARAYGETALNTMKQNGIDEYRLLTAAGSPAASINPVCDTCMDAAAEGWVDIATGFRTGPMPPFHPNCRCDVGANTQGWLPPPSSVSIPEMGLVDPQGMLLTDASNQLYNSTEAVAEQINAATRQTLSQTPEGRDMLDAIGAYAQHMDGAGRTRDMATHILQGQPEFDKEYADRARILLNTISKQPLQTEPVYRGLEFPTAEVEKSFVAKHVVGETIDIPLGSASYSEGHAGGFLPELDALRANPNLAGGVEYVVEAHRGLPISAASQTIWEHEVILSGQFEVVSSEQVSRWADLPFMVTKITLKQVDVFTVPSAVE